MPQVGNFYSHLFALFLTLQFNVGSFVYWHFTALYLILLPPSPPPPPPPQALSGFPSQTEKQNKNSTLFVACDGTFSFSVLQRNS